MGLKHWILPKDHFKTHLFFFQFLGGGTLLFSYFFGTLPSLMDKLLKMYRQSASLSLNESVWEQLNRKGVQRCVWPRPFLCLIGLFECWMGSWSQHNYNLGLSFGFGLCHIKNRVQRLGCRSLGPPPCRSELVGPILETVMKSSKLNLHSNHKVEK